MLDFWGVYPRMIARESAQFVTTLKHPSYTVIRTHLNCLPQTGKPHVSTPARKDSTVDLYKIL